MLYCRGRQPRLGSEGLLQPWSKDYRTTMLKFVQHYVIHRWGYDCLHIVIQGCGLDEWGVYNETAAE